MVADRPELNSSTTAKKKRRKKKEEEVVGFSLEDIWLSH